MTGFRTYFLQTAAILVFIASIFSFLLHTPVTVNSWQGVSVVTFSKNRGDQTESLSAIFGNSYSIDSIYNHYVRIPSFGSGDEMIPLASAGARFIENDPRYTDYLQKLPALYTAFNDNMPYDVYYIEPKMEYSQLFKKLSAFYEPDDFIIPDRPAEPSFVFLAIFVILLVISFFFQKGDRFFGVFIGLPIIGLTIAGDLFSFFAACFLLICIEFFFDIYRKSWENSSLRKLVFILLGLIPWGAVIIFSAMVHRDSLPVMIWGVLPGWIAVLYSWKRHRLNTQKRRIHALFTGVSIFKTDTVFLKRLPFMTAGILVLGATFFYFFYLASPISEYDVLLLPRPMAENEKHVTELLVSTDDYITHSYYVDSFMFGGEYKLPAVDEKITRNVYQKTDEGFFYTEEVLFTSDENWFESAVNNAKGFMGYILKEGKAPVLKQEQSIRVPDVVHPLGMIGYLFILPFLALVEYFRQGNYKRKIFGITSGRQEI